MLEEPRRSARLTADAVDEDSAYFDLDEDKQKALKEAWATLPLYLIQGPPGVGKTRLVREIAARQVRNGLPTRMLLTAQTHQAVDHLLHEVVKETSHTAGVPPPVIVRCRPKETDRERSEFDLSRQAEEIIKSFSKSALVPGLPARLRERVQQLVGSSVQTSDAKLRQGASSKAIEALVLRSSNLVFSSINSAELERLVEERAQFDLSIVEEAAKATGVELVAPFLLSHKRIAIGDHLQLPPFDVETIHKVLSDTTLLKSALLVGWPMVAQPFRNVGLEDIGESIKSLTEAALQEYADSAYRALTLFGTFVDRELYLGHSSQLKVARRLEIQHRMHPVISDVISKAFYDGELKTHKDCKEKFETRQPPHVFEGDAELARTPIILIDVPYVQQAIGRTTEECLPPYHNPVEVAAAVSILARLRASSTSDSRPSLAVLSPYRQQVRQLSTAIDGDQAKLEHLDEFSGGDGDKYHLGTVDSFQGSEADIVLVTLVRNNHHYGLRGLGFLKDSRRMNVLLSRAKWQMIIIGSYDFLRARLESNDSHPGSATAFLRAIIEEFDRLERVELLGGRPAFRRIPLSHVVKG